MSDNAANFVAADSHREGWAENARERMTRRVGRRSLLLSLVKQSTLTNSTQSNMKVANFRR